LSEQDADQIGQYLVDEGLLKWAAFGGVMEITHRGIKEVEQAHSEPDKPTLHFPAVSLIQIGTMTNSQIHQGRGDSVQQMAHVTGDESDGLKAFLAALDGVKRELALSAEAQAEMEVQIATIEAQMKSARPNRSILKSAGAAVLVVLASAPGRDAVEAILKHVPDWIK
jgi:hypothetical protein